MSNETYRQWSTTGFNANRTGEYERRQRHQQTDGVFGTSRLQFAPALLLHYANTWWEYYHIFPRLYPYFCFFVFFWGNFFFFFSLHSEPDNIFTCEIIIASSTYLHAHFLTLTVIYIFLFYFIFSYLKKIVANLLRAMQWWDPSAGICKIQKIKRNFYASLRRRQVPDNHSVRVDRYLGMCTTVRRRRRMHVQL